MKKVLLATAIFALLSALITSCKNSNKKTDQQKEITKTGDSLKMDSTLAFNPSELAEEPMFDIETTEGTIRVKLYKETKAHRENFIKLASEKFYDGILFHRVIKGFMIQTGDPYTKDSTAVARYGTGGPGYTIPAEILPQFKHKKGALAAARRADSVNPKKESSGSQFYIVEDARTCAQLDGEYTVFGETIDGFDVIDKIANIRTLAQDRPEQPIKILSIKPVK